MKGFLFALLVALPAFADSVDLGIEILAPPSALWNAQVQAIVRGSSFGPDQDPSQTVTVNFAVHNRSSFSSAAGTGWNCSGGQTQTDTFGICSHTGIVTGTYPDIVLTFSMPSAAGPVLSVDANIGRSSGNDPGPHPNSAEVVIDSVPPSTFAVGVTPSSPQVARNEVFTYTYSVTNQGPQAAQNVTLQTSLCCNTAGQTPVQFLSANGDGWSCVYDFPTLRCQRPSLAVGPAPQVTVTVRAPNELGTQITGAVVFAANSSSNNASATVEVIEMPDLSLALSGPDSAPPNSEVQHLISVQNLGSAAASTITVTLSDPSIIDAEGAEWLCANAICTLNSLAAFATAPPIVVTSQMPASGEMTIGASVTSNTPDSSSLNNAASMIVVAHAGAVVTTIDPASGSETGGTQVTITGGSFTSGSVALFDGVAVPTTFVSPTTLIATSIAHKPGTVDVTVVTPGGDIATLQHAFTFVPVRRRAARH